MVAEINEKNFKENISQGKVIVDFYADWCGPCKMMSPLFEKLSNEIKEVSFFKVNVDANQQTASMFDIRSIPTTVFLKNGKEVDRVIGFLQEAEFKAKIDEIF